MRSFGWVLYVLLFIGAGRALAVPALDDREGRLDQALSQYASALEESDRDTRLAGFARAEFGFASLVDSGFRNAALLTNLGNAALQAEHPGQAALAYRRALLLDPRASTASQNLNALRGDFPAWVPRPSSLEETRALYFYRRIASPIRSRWAAGFFVAASVCLAISFRRRDGGAPGPGSNPWRGLALACGGIWLLLLVTVVVDSESESFDAAVVTKDETLARSADSRLSALALPEPLPAGVEVTVLEVRVDWARIRLSNGRDVWVRGSSVTRIAQ